MNGTDRTGLLAVLLFAIAVVAISRGDGPSDLLDVVVVGDSFAEQSGDQLLALADDLDMRAEVYAFGGTSICLWRGQLEELAAREPQRLVLSFAGNDMDDCINPQQLQRTGEQVAEIYRTDLEWVLELYRAAGTDLYVVAPPPIQEPAFEARAAAMRDMYNRFSVEHPSIGVIETFDQLGPDRQYHRELPCEADEPCGSDDMVTLREDDGIHLTPEGGKRYAQAIMGEVTGVP
ncbi:MAG TPA: GDSL-type esterase/lipase family protein [Acidimicrobiales bacterium]|nr:GDSL-type esterase/lipase family protein [Acidimicrobiales bacterium]